MAQKSWPSGAPARAAAASIAVTPGSTRMERSCSSGFVSSASNTAAAIANTPGSPEETMTTLRPSAASFSASPARCSSWRLSDGCSRKPSRAGTRAT